MKKLFLLTTFVVNFLLLHAATLTLNPNGGKFKDSPDAESIEITESPATLPVCTPPTGKRFLGWATTSNATEAAYEYPFGLSNYEFDSDVTLWAVYEKIGIVSLAIPYENRPSDWKTYEDFLIVLEDGIEDVSQRKYYSISKYSGSTPSQSGPITGDIVKTEIKLDSVPQSIATFHFQKISTGSNYFLCATNYSSSGIFCLSSSASSGSATWRWHYWSGGGTSNITDIGTGVESVAIERETYNNHVRIRETTTYDLSFGCFKDTKFVFRRVPSNNGTYTLVNQYTAKKTIASYSASSTANFHFNILALYTKKDVSKYRAYFGAGEGGTGSIEYKEGASIVLPEITGISRTYYDFNGWKDAAADTLVGQPGDKIDLTADVILEPIWTPTPRTITWHVGEYGEEIAPSIGSCEQDITFPSVVVTNESKDFVGWADTENGEVTHYVGDTYTPYADADYYAIYANVEVAPMRVIAWEADAVIVEYTGDAYKAITIPAVGSQTESILTNCTVDWGVYRLPVANLSANAGQQMSIYFRDENGANPSRRQPFVPNIVTSSTTQADLVANAGIVVLKGATLTIASDFVAEDVTVAPGACLVVNNEASLTATTMTMRAGNINDSQYDFSYPQLALYGRLVNESGIINYDYLLDNSQYYSLCLPYDVQRLAITYADGQTGLFEIRCYDGDARAAGNSGWKSYPGATLQAGMGYTITAMPKKVSVNGVKKRQTYSLLRLPMEVDLSSADNLENQDKQVPIHVATALNESDYGWNLIGNPFMANFSGIDGLANNGIGLLEQTEEGFEWVNDVRYVVIPSNDGKNYEAQQAASATLPAFKCFFMQLGGGDALSFKAANRRCSALDLSPIRKEQISDDELALGIIMQSLTDSKHTDKIGLLVGEQYSDDYEINADLAKFQANSTLTLYAISNKHRLAFIATDEQSAINIPLGYITTLSGQYTISIDEKYDYSNVASLILEDAEKGVITDLLKMPYSFTTTSQSNTQRFVLKAILKKSSVVTDDKAIIEGRMYASSSSDGVTIYNVLPGTINVISLDGQVVHSCEAVNNVVTIALPHGAYLLRQGNNIVKIIVY